MNHVGIAIDPSTNDIYLGADNNLAMVYDAEAVGQHGRQRLKTFHGEWFLDTEAGVRWLDDLLGKRPNLALAEAMIKAEILDTSGVTGISSFSVRFNRDKREIEAYSIQVETIYDVEAEI